MTNKKRQLRKAFIAVILILLSTIIIINAQDMIQDSSTIQETQVTETQENMNLVEDNTEAANIETEITGNSIQEQVNLCENIDCDDSTLICQDKFIALCKNSCNLETGTCNACTPSCEGHEQMIEQNQAENEISGVLENKTMEITSGIIETNASISELNETGTTNQIENETSEIIENEPIKEIRDETEITNEAGENVGVLRTGEMVIEISLQPDLDIQFHYPEKITRGEVAKIEALITNNGIELKNVAANWILPQDFEIISGNRTENCGNLNKRESCTLTIEIQSSLSTSLGKNQIKITVSYEN